MTKEEEKARFEVERDKKIAAAKESILLAAIKEASSPSAGSKLVNAVHELERVEKEYAFILKELSSPSSRNKVVEQ